MKISRVPLATSLVILSAVAVTAQELKPLTGPEIAILISGNTVVGTMAAGGPYEEFYLPDGTLRGSNYEGKWAVTGDTLCFVYDETTPQQCWGASMTPSGELLWLKNGVVDGNGMVQPGNPSQL